MNIIGRGSRKKEKGLAFRVLSATALGLICVTLMAGMSLKNAFGEESAAEKSSFVPGAPTEWVKNTEPEETPAPTETEETTAAAPRGFWTLEDGGEVYILEDGSFYEGWLRTEEGYLYFGEEGRRSYGWLLLPDGRYFLPEGIMLTGLVSDGEETYLLDENGRSAFGRVDLDGETYLCNEDGSLYRGYLTEDHKLYYYDEETGRLAKNCEVGGYTASATGSLRPSFDRVTADNLDDYARYVLTVNGSTPREIYDYVYNNYTWHYTGKADEMTMTLRMFNSGSGGCWDYSAITCCLLRAAGYNAMFIKGYTPNNQVHEHDWVLVEIEDGVWRHMDPMRQGFDICLLTDKQISAYNGLYNMSYDWDRSKYPACEGDGAVKIVAVEKSDKTKRQEAATAENPTEPAETKAPETREDPAETRPAETKPEETDPAETSPEETMAPETPAETAAPTAPPETKAPETQPESKPEDSNSSEGA